MGYWTIPPMWKGRTVAILASGPSLTRAAADAVRHLPRIAINSTFLLAPDADIIYGCDRAWWKANPGAFNCTGLKVGMEPAPRGIPVQPYPDLVLRHGGQQGYNAEDMGSITSLHNSGGQAIQIAVKAGAARVLLLGFDMRPGHWHGPHPWPLRNAQQKTYEEFIAAIARMSRMLPASTAVINCTPGSALRCFRMIALEDALAETAVAA